MSVDMDAATIERIARQLIAIGEDMQRDWTRFRREVEAAEAGIGAGPLGTAFRTRYTPAADAVRNHADPIPRWWLLAGDAGTKSVVIYCQADRAAACEFPK